MLGSHVGNTLQDERQARCIQLEEINQKFIAELQVKENFLASRLSNYCIPSLRKPASSMVLTQRPTKINDAYAIARPVGRKLSLKFYGSYQILEAIREAAYLLDLSPESKIHPVFHAYLLKPYYDDPKPQTVTLPPKTWNNDPLHEPLAITDTRRILRQGKEILQALVQWTGLAPEENTWEDLSDRKKEELENKNRPGVTEETSQGDLQLQLKGAHFSPGCAFFGRRKMHVRAKKCAVRRKLRALRFDLIFHTAGPDRAFGDLIAASGITEDMIDSLILLRDVRGIKGLPPLTEIEDKAIEKLNATSSRAEVERKKQEEIASARVRKVDGKGRAYGTGRRKCSVARVWVQPGDGKFTINEKEFDFYFPIIDHRADLLRPFTVTNTLGLWDVTCTVKGGGVSGESFQPKISSFLFLGNIYFRSVLPFLKAAGFITRDPRVVERKKPGKAKARKSFQWVKR
ncbi:hypothetical protein KSP39_PZI020006 [Platanthera zijinensis]|uniref:Tf2-1-like SH3-like domain-containing protein n=1 Tax=Platanthera zijinensis TaxID=2320716 RepID=A0AAP0B0Q2_9ASPA